ncbi:MAG TPA: NAD(P)H-binding protein [Acidimicrobiia bacterium]|nr:NAD(P)H-binding protein [Acidimicrobiia bacterium]
MRIAVAGATGSIGSLTVGLLEGMGHHVVRISRSVGIDLVTGSGLEGALDGVDAVIDVTSTSAGTRRETIERFGVATRNLLDAGEQAGVGHHVLLSILGVDRVDGNAHFAGKREQERLVIAGRVPWTIIRASQFHDFAGKLAQLSECDGTAHIAPLLVQPIAPREVAQVLVDRALGVPALIHIDVAGPEPQDLVDMARRTLVARGRSVTVVPTWSKAFGPSMAGNVLLPGDDAHLGSVTFDEWLADLDRAEAP